MVVAVVEAEPLRRSPSSLEVIPELAVVAVVVTAVLQVAATEPQGVAAAIPVVVVALLQAVAATAMRPPRRRCLPRMQLPLLRSWRRHLRSRSATRVRRHKPHSRRPRRHSRLLLQLLCLRDKVSQTYAALPAT